MKTTLLFMVSWDTGNTVYRSHKNPRKFPRVLFLYDPCSVLFSIRFFVDLNYIEFSCNKKDYYKKKISAIQRHNTGGMTIELSC